MTTLTKRVANTKMLNYGNVIDEVLVELLSHKKSKNLQDLRGKISFRDDYDYKSLRN
ncbi:MAG: type II toxin-antitoxin system VapB family antitoxin [Bacteroidetes bacterium]|nr:type II toxin-antitoxin system VapB family antitoxin [Bacteroidota bacterium]